MKKNKIIAACTRGFSFLSSSINHKAIDRTAREKRKSRQCKQIVRIGQLVIAGIIGISIVLPLSAETQQNRQWGEEKHKTVIVLYAIELPAQSVADSLNALASQTGAEFLFPYTLAKTRQASPVSGRYSINDAVQRLLQGSGLVSGFDQGVLVISDPENSGELADYRLEGKGGMKMQSKKKLLAAIIGMFGGSGVLAQDSTADTGGNIYALEEVVVTAQKKGAESIQEIPFSIEVKTGEFIEKTGFVDFEDYARTITNLGFTPPVTGNTVVSGAGLSMRGISSSVANQGGAVVALYLDDTPVSGLSFMGNPFDARLFDIERVEVLKGPQGNLYGSSAMGGVIKTITKKPVLNEDVFRYDGSISSTRYGGVNINNNMAVNVPLVEDVAALRLTVTQGYDDGFIDHVSRFSEISSPNDANHNTTNLLSFRASILYQPTDWLTITPMVYSQRKNTEGSHAVSEDLFGVEGNPQLSTYVDEELESKFTLYSITAEMDTAIGTVTSITSYLDSLSETVQDATEFLYVFLPDRVGTPLTIEDTVNFPGLYTESINEVFTQELRFASSWDFPVALTAGAYYQDAHTDVPQIWQGPLGSGDILGLGSDLFYTGVFPTDNEEKALFGNLAYETGSWEFQVGARYFDIDVEREVIFGGLGPSFFRGKTSDDGVSLSSSISYTVSEDHRVYARVAEGFRQGLVTQPPLASLCGDLGDVITTEPDTVINYEVGARTEWADGRFRINPTVFMIEYTDVQQQTLLECGNTVQSNAGDATSTGFEVDFVAAVTDSLIISGGVGYVDSSLDQDEPAVGGDKGESLLNVPEWTANAAVEYTLPLKTDSEVYARADWSFIDEKMGDFGVIGEPPTEALKTDAYSIWSARLGLISPDQSWETSIFVNNLLDERANLGVSTFGTARTYINKPRTIGLNFKKDF